MLEAELKTMETEVLQSQAAAGKASEDAQQAENLCQEYALKVDQLSVTHTSQMETLQAAMAEAETQQKHLVNDARHEQEEKTNDLSITHETEMNAIRAKLVGVEAKLKATEDVFQGQEEKINELLTAHRTEVEHIRAELTESKEQQKRLTEKFVQDLEEAKAVVLEQGSKEMASQLEGQKSSYEETLSALKDELTNEKSNGADATSQAARLTDEIANLHNQLRGEKDTSTKRIRDTEKHLEDKMEEILTSNKVREAEILRFKRELQESKLSHTQALEEAKRIASKQISELEDVTTTLNERIVEMESKSKADMDSHAELLRAKELEISELGLAVETLQIEVQHVHQNKGSELDSVKAELIHEHDTAMSKLRAGHESDIKKVREGSLQEISRATTDHQSEIEQLQQEHQKFRSENKATLSELRRSKDEMQNILDMLETERDAARASKEELENSFRDASNDVSSLKTELETLKNSSKQSDQQHASDIRRIQDELERTVELLKKTSEENSISTDGPAKELQALRDAHAKEVEALNADHTEKNDQAMRKLQTKYNDLLQVWKQSEESHPRALDALKTDHLNAIEKAQILHVESIQAVKTELESKHSQEKWKYDIESAQNAASVEERHHREIEDIKQKHEASVSTAENAHEDELSELRAQILQSGKDLADKDRELQAASSVQSTSHQDARDARDLQIQELQDQLMESRSDTTITKAELNALRQERLDIETLKDQHSAEAKRIQSLQTKDKARIEELLVEIENISSKELEDSEVDSLRQEISELKYRHTTEIAKFQGTSDIEVERREKEEAANAETQKRLVTELEDLEQIRKDLRSAKQEADHHREKLEIAEREVQTLRLKLEEASSTCQDKENQQRNVLAQVEELQAEVAALKNNVSDSEGLNRPMSRHSEEVDSPQTAHTEGQDVDQLKKQLEAEKENTEKLKEKLANALADVQKQAIKKRELEAALKVTTAQLTEEQTKRGDGRTFTSSPTPRTPLRTSRWPSTDETQDVSDGGNGEQEGEDLGSHIQGTVGLPFLYSAIC